MAELEKTTVRTAGQTETLKADLIALMPALRAYSRSLCTNQATADDMVQEALVKALDNLHRFEIGTSIRAWVFTILRNTYYTALRKSRREVEDADGAHAARLCERPSQDGAVDLEDFKRVFQTLSEDHREVLMLIGAAGLSYEEVAEICQCAIGTVKSRVNRARAKLGEALGMQPDEFIVDPDRGSLPPGVLTGSW
jgi:RNA polymerase sigma-70 factor (ECF subfamily)